MRDFKVGDRVRILPGVATPFVGMDGTICEVLPHDQGIEAMTRHFVVFSRNEKRSFYREELVHVPRQT
jgi:transcription antitermination factor NusG